MIIVKSIVYKPKSESGGHNVGYLRRPLQEANLVESYGIEGDRKGGNPNRNLNVMDAITIEELAAQGYPTGPGVLGENIILSGVDLRALPEGTQLRLGDEAVIALGKPRIPCEQLTPLDARMPENVAGRVGVMCRVVKSGRVRVDDAVEVTTVAVQSQANLAD
jgi:MOSC domain-containing protein YiiM